MNEQRFNLIEEQRKKRLKKKSLVVYININTKQFNINPSVTPEDKRENGEKN